MEMKAKIFSIILLAAGFFGTSLAFWSLETDVQFGYEIYDRSYEINAAIQAILAASTRNNVIQNDPTTQSSVIALNSIASQLRSAPITFFNELAYAASSRTNNENWHLSRLRTYHATYIKQLDILSNSTGPKMRLVDITNPSIMQTMDDSLYRIHKYSEILMIDIEELCLKVSTIRSNSSLLLTPKLIDDFIEIDLIVRIQTSLVQIRNSYLLLLSSVRDTARLIGAHGSMYDILDRSYQKDSLKRNSSLYKFSDSYNRVRNTLMTSVVSYRQTAQTEFTNFIQRIKTTYDDTIVRPRFDNEQLPKILAFVEVVTLKVYNQTFFETSFDSMRDAIVELYTNETNDVFALDSSLRDEILNLLRQSYARHYASCLDELISESQEGRNLITGKYTFCLDERTDSVTVVIPSTSSWLSVIRDNVNFILNQLNACINGQISVAGRTATSECIQSNANNLQFYAMYLPLTVQTNLRPIVESPPIIFRNCIGVVKSSVSNYESFKDILEKCSRNSNEDTTTVMPESITDSATTTEPTTDPATTEEPITDPATTEEPITDPATTTEEIIESTYPETTASDEDYTTATSDFFTDYGLTEQTENVEYEAADDGTASK